MWTCRVKTKDVSVSFRVCFFSKKKKSDWFYMLCDLHIKQISVGELLGHLGSPDMCLPPSSCMGTHSGMQVSSISRTSAVHPWPTMQANMVKVACFLAFIQKMDGCIAHRTDTQPSIRPTGHATM